MRIVAALTAGLMALTLSACTTEQILFYNTVTQPTAHVLNAEQLHRLRWCESRGDYEAVSRTGKYRGAYQFSRSTWDSVASRHFPWLVGVDPIVAEFYWQDAMTRALWSERGRQPWPVCGLKV
jgi:hypothetical protein